MEEFVKLPILRRRADDKIVMDDALALIAAYGARAYDEARTRARQERLGKVIDSNRTRGHWDRVRRAIARRTGREVGVDAATRYTDAT